MNTPKYVQLYREDLEFKNYAENSISNYECQVASFLNYHNELFTEPSKINKNHIKRWVMLSPSINGRKHRISALKLFYKFTIKQPMKFINIEYPKSEKKLPLVIDSEFLKKTILAIPNLKHKAIIMLGYSCSLRVSEVVNLKIEDIDSNRMLINIRNAKGRKDRIVILSPLLLETLRSYFKVFKPSIYLFNGQSENTQYTSSSCNAIVKQYLGKIYHFHTLRHSGATTMHESGVDLSIIQNLLGHTNIKTTMIYTHISQKRLSTVVPPM